MSELVEPGQEEQQRSLLGAALSIEYGPCSVAAAELSRQAAEISRRKPYRDFHLKNQDAAIVVDSGYPEIRKVDQQLLFNVQSYDDKNTTLPFAVVAGQEKRKSRGLRKKVSSEGRVGDGAMWLGYRIADGRVLLPIATFEPREDGNCSYVQLGSEISDDSLFVVQGDEQTERLAIIEDLRKLVKPGFSRAMENTPEYTSRIKQFVQSEIARRSKYIACALGGCMSKEFDHKISKEGKKTTTVIINEDGSATQYEDASYIDIADSKVVIDSITESSVRAVKDSASNTIKLCALIRGNVGFPFAEFNTQTGESRIIDYSESKDSNTHIVMMAAMALSRGNGVCREEFRSLAGVNYDISPDVYLYNALDLGKRIREVLSPECKYQESLARVIGEKALGVCLEGRVDDVDMLTTRGSVSGHIITKMTNSELEARIYAKPDALKGIPRSEIKSFVYDPTTHLGDNLPKGKDAEEFATLLRGFSKARKP